jgi:hypothetical protein
MVAVDAVIIEVLSCNKASMRYIFKGEKPANLPAPAIGAEGVTRQLVDSCRRIMIRPARSGHKIAKQARRANQSVTVHPNVPVEHMSFVERSLTLGRKKPRTMPGL